MPDDMSPGREPFIDDGRQSPGAAVAPPPHATRPQAKPGRKRLFGLLAAVVVLGAIAYAVYYSLALANYISTDDAYVGADVAQVTPLVPGPVQAVMVQDTQAVKAGDVLVVINPADSNIAVAQARAQYRQAVERVHQYFANNQASTAQIAARDADLTRAAAQLAAAQSDLDRTRIDLQRRQALASSGAVSGEELTSANNAYQTAVANLAAVKAGGAQAQANRTIAQGQLASGLALTEGTDVESNPEVLAAKAALDGALLNQSRALMRAPFDGVVAQRQVQVGQRVAVGDKLMSIVPVNKVYVDANFKEVQLRTLRIGQPVELTTDRWGPKVTFHGRVAGLSGGTGAAFAQNATGNWIKVVQRLPVRITLDPRELQQHPLRVGLSAVVSVNVSAGVGHEVLGAQP